MHGPASDFNIIPLLLVVTAVFTAKLLKHTFPTFYDVRMSHKNGLFTPVLDYDNGVLAQEHSAFPLVPIHIKS